MSHMVIFRTPEGKPGYQPAHTVQEAVEVVERLRNEDGVENVRIFRLEEVAFEYKPYFRVELRPSPADGAASNQDEDHEGAGTHDTSANDVDHMAVESSDSIETSSSDLASMIGEEPSWDSTAPVSSVFGDLHDPVVEDAAMNEATGTRRGLFAR